jgi:hypothetical protein
MANEKTTSTVVSDRALEMIMRDVIDSMCELSLESGFQPTDGGFEIIEIYPAQHENTMRRSRRTETVEESEVIEFPTLRRATG